MNMDNLTFQTKDLPEASYLLARGRSLLNTIHDGHICWFVFEDKDNTCKSLTDEFWQGRGTINAKLYYDSMQRLKNEIFSKKSL